MYYFVVSLFFEFILFQYIYLRLQDLHLVKYPFQFKEWCIFFYSVVKVSACRIQIALKYHDF
jgi:hypothetical protein